MQVILVHSLGAMAADSLKSQHQGTLVAVFQRSFYLQMQNGALICFGFGQLGLGPLHALCEAPGNLSWQQRGLVRGQDWQQTDQGLSMSGDYSFVWRNAIVWHPAPAPADISGLPLGLNILCQIIENHSRPDGFGILIPYFIQGFPLPQVTADPVLQHAIPAIEALTDWLHNTAQSEPTAAQRLIGLGYGLTPSGDDFIGGLLIALRALGATGRANRLAGWLLPVARAGTGAISFAHLQCAAAGTGSAILHDMLAALCLAERTEIAGCLSAIRRIGHSSGWDMLAGIVCGCAILAAKPLAASKSTPSSDLY
jgi:hypothetical protein